MKKRLLSTLLTLCMVLALLPATALAAYTQFVIKDGVLTQYQGPGGEVIIPDGVTSIGASAFRYIARVTNVTIPDSVTSIEEHAFDACKLTSVSIPDSVTSIGKHAFANCYNLTSVTIPDSVTSIGEGAFLDCENLTRVTISNGITSISNYLFHACFSLTSVTIPDSVTSIGECAFIDCDSLTSVVIPGRVTSIERGAFELCDSLTSVTIPASVTAIGEDAFCYCDSLKNVYYGGSESQWKQIAVKNGNAPLLNANIHYNSAVPSAPSTPSVPSTPSAPSAPSTPAAPSGISVTVGGTAVAWTDAAPFIDANSRTMVPLRAVADAMSLTVNWDGNARVAAFSDGGKTISFPIDNNIAQTSDGGAVEMDTAAVIANERTYAPIRYLAEYFGYEVGWDAATQTVTLK